MPDIEATMPSPPAGHPFLRPAVPPAAHQPLVGPGAKAAHGTTYYRPLALGTPGAGSETGLAPNGRDRAPSVRTAGSRSESRASNAPPLSSHHTPSRASARSPIGSARGANGSADPAAHGTNDADEPPRKLTRWEEKVQGDLAGWRGGHGKPFSSVPQAGVPSETYYGQPTTGVIGKDLPKEIVRIERDWALGDICQFSTAFPLELESRVSPTKFAEFIEALNVHLHEAYSTRGAVVDNLIAVATWWTSMAWRPSYFERQLRRGEQVISDANRTMFNPVGLNVLSPRFVALQYLEIEYY